MQACPLELSGGGTQAGMTEAGHGNENKQEQGERRVPASYGPIRRGSGGSQKLLSPYQLWVLKLHDLAFQRQCERCSTTETPEWRSGPDGIVLCNACGLKHRREVKAQEETRRRGSIAHLLN